MSFKEYSDYRKVDPYVVPRNPRFSSNGLNAWFSSTPYQLQVYNDVYVPLKRPVPESGFFDIEHMRKNPTLFGEALDMCERFVLLPIMEVKCDYVELMVAQFYATLCTLEPMMCCSLKWMTKDKVMDYHMG